MKKNIAAIVIMCWIILYVGIYVHSSMMARSITGPIHLAVYGDVLVVADNYTLSLLNKSGDLLAQRTFDTLGISSTLMDLQALPDGTLLLGESGSKRIIKCPSISQPCLEFVNLGKDVGRFYKFRYEPANNVLYVAVTHSNVVMRFPSRLSDSHTTVIDSILRSPNEIQLDEQNRLWIADTDNRRIVAVNILEDPSNHILSEVSGKNHFTKNSFPLDFARDVGGKLWTLLSNSAYLNGQVVRYGASGQAERYVAFPPTTCTPVINNISS